MKVGGVSRRSIQTTPDGGVDYGSFAEEVLRVAVGYDGAPGGLSDDDDDEVEFDVKMLGRIREAVKQVAADVRAFEASSDDGRHRPA